MAAQPVGRRQNIFPCDFEGCEAIFRSHEELTRHKVEPDAEHEFCTVCNRGFVDWVTFIKHKIASDKHICCPACGQEFESDSGKERHIRLAHQKNQALICIGCQGVFSRASSLVGHLEEGRCSGISSETFKTQLHRKEVLTNLLKEPSRATEPSYVGSDAGTSYVEVVLNPPDQIMDQTDHIGENKVKNLVTLTPSNSSVRTSTGNQQPSGPRAGTMSSGSLLAGSMSSGSMIGSTNYRGRSTIDEDDDNGRSVAALDIAFRSATLGDNLAPTPKDNIAPISKDKGKSKTKPTEPFPPLSSNPTTTQAGTTAWSSAPSSSVKLFPDAPQTPLSTADKAAVFAAGLEQIDNDFARRYGLPQSSVAATTMNLMKSQDKLWDLSWYPDNENYSPEKFFNQTMQKYECPHRHCSFTTPLPSALSEHLLSPLHSIKQRRCPSCLRAFKTSAALVSHCESASTRCNVSQTVQFEKVMEQVTGGFLTVESEERRRREVERERMGRVKEGLKEGRVVDREGKVVGGEEWDRRQVSYKAMKPGGL